MFGNPGSTELPMLRDYPGGLQVRPRPPGGRRGRHGRRLRPGERRARARQPAHRARGGQRDGRDLQRPGQPLAAGDHRGPAGALAGDAAGEPHQPRRDPDAAPAGQVELRAGAAPRTCRWRSARATHLATLPPRGPTFVSIPMDDWDAEVDDAYAGAAIARRTERPRRRGARGRRASSPAGSRRPTTRCSSPARTSTRAAPGRLRSPSPSASACPCSPSRRPGAAGSASLRATRNFRGVLPPAIGPVSETLAGHDLILVVGSSVFPYYPNIPGPAPPRGRRAGRDHVRPRRGSAGADGRCDRRRRAG